MVKSSVVPQRPPRLRDWWRWSSTQHHFLSHSRSLDYNSLSAAQAHHRRIILHQFSSSTKWVSERIRLLSGFEKLYILPHYDIQVDHALEVSAFFKTCFIPHVEKNVNKTENQEFCFQNALLTLTWISEFHYFNWNFWVSLVTISGTGCAWQKTSVLAHPCCMHRLFETRRESCASAQFQDTTDALLCHIHLHVCLWIMDPNSRAPKKNASHGNEVLPQDTTHLIQSPCYQRGSLCQDPAGNQTMQRPPDHCKETQTAVVWSCLPFIRSGQNHARHSERGKKTRQTEEEMGRQHQGMDRPGARQVPEGNGEQGKMEETGCKIICGAPTTLTLMG